MDFKRRRRIDFASTLTLAVTVLLFGVALFEKGFTHDLLLEAGVFLVSVKLVLGAKKAELDRKGLEIKLDLLLQREQEVASKEQPTKARLTKV